MFSPVSHSITTSAVHIFCMLNRNSLRLSIKKKQTKFLRHWKERGTTALSRLCFLMQIASSACYCALVRKKFLHVFQWLYPFYIPILTQSVLEQSLLSRTLLLRQVS